MEVKKKKQQGLALVSSIMLSSIIMIIMGVVLFRIVSTTSDVTNLKKNDAAKNIADEGLEHVIDWMNNRNSPTSYVSPTRNKDEASLLVQNMTSTEFLLPINSVSYSYYLSSNTYMQEGETVYKRNSNSNLIFPPILGAKISSIVLNGSTISGVPYSSKVFTFKDIENQTSKIKGDFQIAWTQVASSNPKYDLIKLFSISSIPSISAENKTVRKFVALVQRPKDVSISLDHAILSDGDINLGNGNADGSYTNDTTLVTKEGDVHTNGDLRIGAGGYVDGDASATGTVTIDTGGQVTGTVTSSASEKPVPEMDYENPFPTASCVEGGTHDNTIINGPCTYTGNYSISGNQTLTITGKVYIKGNYSETGNARIISASPMAMLIVTGDLKTAGNGSTDVNKKMAFVSTGGDMSVVGNGDIKGLFVNENPSGDISITGNGNVFGGIIAKGTVAFSGQNSTVIRDLNMSNAPFKIPADSYNMRLVSWKEIK